MKLVIVQLPGKQAPTAPKRVHAADVGAAWTLCDIVAVREDRIKEGLGPDDVRCITCRRILAGRDLIGAR